MNTKSDTRTWHGLRLSIEAITGLVLLLGTTIAPVRADGPVVRDHRGGNGPVYVEHQEGDGSPPIIRDHRQENSPVINDHRDPAIRISWVLHKLIVHNDLDVGAGEVKIGVRVWRVNPGCPDNAFWDDCITPMMKIRPMSFSADDGEEFLINAAFPSFPDEALAEGVSSRYGIPLVAGERYGWEISGSEDDTISDDAMGQMRGTMSEANGWAIGRYTQRAEEGSLPTLTGACVSCPGNFTMDFSIQRIRLPDLLTKSIRVDQPIPERPASLCALIQNVGPRPGRGFSDHHAPGRRRDQHIGHVRARRRRTA